MPDLHFTAHGNLVNILGTKLIDELSVAVLELVKNSYDADATLAEIKLDKIFDPEDAIVIVHDDGKGMTLDDIQNRWLVAGFSEKEGQVLRRERTPRGRFPLGRMGIGRFAAARLGRRLIMVTRAKGHPELRVDIDWDRIASTSDLSAARIAVVTHNEPKIFTGAATGTRLAISAPQQPWTRADLQALQTQLRRFISPHTRVPDFSVRLTVPAAPEFENLERFRESTPSHFACSAEVLDDGTAVLRWDNFITGESSEDYINLFSFFSASKRGNRSRPECGPFSVQLVAWKGTKTDLKKIGIADPDHLDEITGISIFRDGFRVLPYGDPGHDWLELNLRRVNSPSDRFSTNRLLGSVHITSEKNPGLADQANRLGLIENQAYSDFKELTLQVIGALEKRVLTKRTRLTLTARESSPSSMPLTGRAMYDYTKHDSSPLAQPRPTDPYANKLRSTGRPNHSGADSRTIISNEHSKSTDDPLVAALSELLLSFEKVIELAGSNSQIYQKLSQARDTAAEAFSQLVS